MQTSAREITMADRDDMQYDETEHPRNPPNAVANPRVRSQAFWSYLGPLIALFAIIAIALIYWLGRPPGTNGGDNTLNPTIGTTGEQQRPARDLDQGGFDPQRHPTDTQDELKQRGVENPDKR